MGRHNQGKGHLPVKVSMLPGSRDIAVIRCAPGPRVDFSSVFGPFMMFALGLDVEEERFVVAARQGARKARCMGSALAAAPGNMRPKATVEGRECMM